ncbi:MAG: helix-turn-helix transcriptional regulator [Clostridia bacterium]|nr:helix-turn-helix transcriptional regulator [Clostridia bacterium]
MKCVSYNKLWKLLIDRRLTKTQLRVDAEFSTSTLAKLTKNQTVSLNVIVKICELLQCDISDVMEVVNE